jgi:hypothetical protein
MVGFSVCLEACECSTLRSSAKGRLQSAERAVPTHCRQLIANLLSA